jgi:hypothetical protein
MEDEMSYWLGPVFVKLLRLFINLTVSVHLFCCAYWRIKVNAQLERMYNLSVYCFHSLLPSKEAIAVFFSGLWIMHSTSV